MRFIQILVDSSAGHGEVLRQSEQHQTYGCQTYV